jgi:hypothetical protein
MGSSCTKVEQRTTVRHDGEKSEVRTTTTIDGKETGHTVLNFYMPTPPTPVQPPRISVTPAPNTIMRPPLPVQQQQQQPFPQPPPPPYILPRPEAIPPHPQVPAVLASGVQPPPPPPPPPQAVPPTANFLSRICLCQYYQSNSCRHTTCRICIQSSCKMVKHQICNHRRVLRSTLRGFQTHQIPGHSHHSPISWKWIPRTTCH